MVNILIIDWIVVQTMLIVRLIVKFDNYKSLTHHKSFSTKEDI